MKADLPRSESERAGAEDQREVRAALVRRHVEVIDGQHAMEAVQMALDVRGSDFRALAERMRD